MHKTILFLTSLSILGACGGGGGAGGGLLPASLLPPADNGHLVTAELEVTSSGDALGGGTSAISTGAFIRDENDALRKNGRIVASQPGSGLILEHSTFGHWQEVHAGRLDVAFASYGKVTQSSALPGEDARYTGQSRGLVQDKVNGILGATASRVQIDVTNGFRDVAMYSKSTAVRDLNTSVTRTNADYDFSGSGHVSGAGFDVSVRNTGSATALSGRAKGQFYGPNAQEIGGAFKMTDTNGSSYIGSFSGAR